VSTINFDWIKTEDECTEVTDNANVEKAQVETRITNLEQKLGDKIAKGPGITNEFEANQIQGASVKTWVEGLPESDLKSQNLKTLKRLEIRQITLGNRVESYNVVALLETQLDLAIAKLIRSEIVAFIDGVAARKAAIKWI
jgi:hypothetical protein